jgi:hypothetical protein
MAEIPALCTVMIALCQLKGTGAFQQALFSVEKIFCDVENVGWGTPGIERRHCMPYFWFLILLREWFGSRTLS